MSNYKILFNTINIENINRRVLIGLAMLLCCIVNYKNVIAQSSDMQRDLTVIEAVITEIVNSEFGQRSNFSNNKTKVSYVEGRGILIKIPNLNSSGNAWGRNFIQIITDDEDDEGIIVNSNAISSATNGDVKDKEEELLEKIEKVMRTFLVNYGDLARDLPENEKIILLFKKKRQSGYNVISGNAIGIGPSHNNSSEDVSISQFSAEVLKSDITKLATGKLSEDEFWDRVSLKKISAKSSEKEKLEYNVLGQIFKSRLSDKGREIKEQDDHVIIIGMGDWHRVDYELVSGLGVVYNINVNLSFKSNIFIKGFVNNKGEKEKLEELAEKAEEADKDRDEKLEILMDELVGNIKEDMISYGKTLRSLPQDEMLIVEINLPRCYDCDLPGTYQLSISKKLLEEYEKRNISFENAVDRIKIKEIDKAKDKSGNGSFYFDWRD